MKRRAIFRDSFKLGALPLKGGVSELPMAAGIELLGYDGSETSLDSDNELLRVKAISQIETRGRETASVGTTETMKKAWKRAMAEAKADAVLWTPVLEAIAKVSEKFVYVNDELERLGEEISEHVKLVGALCGQEPLSGLLEQARHFDFFEIRSVIWENARDIKAGDIDALFD